MLGVAEQSACARRPSDRSTSDPYPACRRGLATSTADELAQAVLECSLAGVSLPAGTRLNFKRETPSFSLSPLAEPFSSPAAALACHNPFDSVIW
ncbi:hypothetical protein KQX54_020307 [Cotesia glomerata]|uniref:Uncharacterized protein n=1 Tax=Cotesia glomerata TaxID=32391 RepID=A0AAV7IJM1_COTGL|nr:hypothetical protein KQX54_020307 [Cotesia glomerata]